MLCDGVTGTKKNSFNVGDSLEQGVWLTTNSLVLLDHSGDLYAFDAGSIDNSNPVGGKGLVKLRQLGGGDPTYSLAADSDHSVSYVDGGNVWRLDISKNQPFQLTHLDGATLEWLDYSQANEQYLFCCRSAATEGGRHLYKFNPRAPRDAQLTLLVTNNVLKGRWLQGDSGFAWVGTGSRGDFLIIQTKNTALSTNLFDWALGGDYGAMSVYGISPNREKLYAVGAVYSSNGESIWEYDVTRQTLRNVTPGQHPTAYSRQIIPIQAWTTNSDGKKVDYFYLPPAKLDSHKRYPVVMTQYSGGRYHQNFQAIANAGIFCVSQNHYGKDYFKYPTFPSSEDTLAVYRDIVRNPNVDPYRVYISGESASTSGACQIVEMYPSLWRGILLLSPTTFPNRTGEIVRCPSVFISEGDEEELTLQAQCERAMLNADLHLTRAELVYGHAGHAFSSTEQLKQRYLAMARFVLTDF